jgi:hypothetical protein
VNRSCPLSNLLVPETAISRLFRVTALRQGAYKHEHRQESHSCPVFQTRVAIKPRYSRVTSIKILSISATPRLLELSLIHYNPRAESSQPVIPKNHPSIATMGYPPP